MEIGWALYGSIRRSVVLRPRFPTRKRSSPDTWRKIEFMVVYLGNQQMRALSSSGRAPALQAGGGRFESGRVHQKIRVSGFLFIYPPNLFRRFKGDDGALKIVHWSATHYPLTIKLDFLVRLGHTKTRVTIIIMIQSS